MQSFWKQEFNEIFKPFITSLEKSLAGSEANVWNASQFGPTPISKYTEKPSIMADVDALELQGIRPVAVVDSPDGAIYIIDPSPQGTPLVQPVAIAPGVNAHFGSAEWLAISEVDFHLKEIGEADSYHAMCVPLSFSSSPEGIRVARRRTYE